MNAKTFFRAALLLFVAACVIVLRLPAFGISAGSHTSERLAKGHFAGGFLLGILFALSFCPISAALFFGSLIPLATASRSSVMLPALYGLGTSLPVFAFAFLIAIGAKSVAGMFDRLISMEVWARRVTGALFIFIGIYLSWNYLIA
jgi:cytochrome c biogenesis protein CcdA